MDARLAGRVASYSNEAPALIVGSSECALTRAARIVEARGLRLADQVMVGTAAARIDQQVTTSVLWLEIDDDCSGLDPLLDKVNREARQGRYAAVVAASAKLVDAVMARVDAPEIEVVVDGEESERAAALAVALAHARQPLRLSDVAADRSAARLRQLSEEVSRIASTLARLSSGPPGAVQHSAPAVSGEPPPIRADTVRGVIRARRLRARYFPEDLFADPAWDMLLDLLQAELAELRVPVSSLCIAAAVPATTALRWLKTLVDRGLFIRRADPHDGRRVFVELAPETSSALRRYFAEIEQLKVV